MIKAGVFAPLMRVCVKVSCSENKILRSWHLETAEEVVKLAHYVEIADLYGFAVSVYHTATLFVERLLPE
jgi:hypothetical protein